MNDAISSLEIPSLQELKFSSQKNATSYNWKALFWELRTPGYIIRWVIVHSNMIHASNTDCVTGQVSVH